MEKLKLHIDALEVESFPTSEAADGAGTVLGAEATLHTGQCGTCAGPTCNGDTCFTSCGAGGDPACTCPIP